jgi:hypothetical protein
MNKITAVSRVPLDKRTALFKVNLKELAYWLGKFPHILTRVERVEMTDILVSNRSKIKDGFEPLLDDSRVMNSYVRKMRKRIKARLTEKGEDDNKADLPCYGDYVAPSHDEIERQDSRERIRL